MKDEKLSAFGLHLAEEAPRFVATLWHRRYAGKLLFGVLWPVAAAQSADKADYLTPKFQPAVNQRVIEQLANESVSCDEDVTTGPKRAADKLAPLQEELTEAGTFLAV